MPTWSKLKFLSVLRPKDSVTVGPSDAGAPNSPVETDTERKAASVDEKVEEINVRDSEEGDPAIGNGEELVTAKVNDSELQLNPGALSFEEGASYSIFHDICNLTMIMLF